MVLCNSLVLQELKNGTPANLADLASWPLSDLWWESKFLNAWTSDTFLLVCAGAGWDEEKSQEALDSTWLCWCRPFQFALQVVLEWSTLKRKPDRLRDVEGMTSDFSNDPPSVGVPRKKKNKSKQGHCFLNYRVYIFPYVHVQADPADPSTIFGRILVLFDTHFLHSTEAWVRSNCWQLWNSLALSCIDFSPLTAIVITSWRLLFKSWGIVWKYLLFDKRCLVLH